MREILFRGKNKFTGNWCEGFLVKTGDHFRISTQNDLISFGVYPESVGQYTGLTDKNGKKIFEGDIVECCSKGIRAQGAVQQRKDGMWIIHPAWQKHIMWGLCPDENMHTTVEIIGNIHDNPELIQQIQEPKED